ncbi:Crp/Fnr family transcriptional regulator [Xanthocytophaga agilis]|uniref:Crp/Fnr family transcriptional regulator n=1 Tax=Xanthocytophaga agilis TaxID=3048010 RepID=A0AAE3RCH7_9BACT|nr:Crp/Fnr family transcriptional regulator [Xanthocytophaga agilis]MDJ1505885.1 Crp/Fnr family transcriptional regulator [Xanthocytophaga agilis]
MEKLKAVLSFGGILTNSDIATILSYFEERELESGEYFLTIGNVCNEIGFICSGVVRTYLLSEGGEEVTRYFFRENQFIVDLESYYSRKPSTYPLQAVVKSRINCIRHKDWEKLTETIPQLFILTKVLSEALLLTKLKDTDFLNFGTATDKYREFIRRYPDLALYVPQQYIASYLNITPQSLSRIRKTIAF